MKHKGWDLIEEHKIYLEHSFECLDYLLHKMVKPYELAIQLLKMESGIGRQPVIKILSEIDADMITSMRLCC